jgi:serine/threonine-protein kinase
MSSDPSFLRTELAGAPDGGARPSSFELEGPLGGIAPGFVIADRYRVEGFVGRGGMGTVLAARHLALGHLVAIKVLAGGDADARERFLREGRAVASLQSAHVVRVFDVGTFTLAGHPIDFLVMELLEGETLADLLRSRTRLPAELAAEIVQQACLAMTEAHAKGLIHRDLKPSNLFLSQRAGRPWVRVLDFGISKREESGAPTLTTTTTLIGSPAYMAPEQVRNGKTVDARADIWALGVVLFECLSGRRPFDGDTTLGLCANILIEPPAELTDRDAPIGLRRVVERAMEKQPQARYPSAEALAQALSPWVGAEGGVDPASFPFHEGTVPARAPQPEVAAASPDAQPFQPRISAQAMTAAVAQPPLLAPPPSEPAPLSRAPRATRPYVWFSVAASIVLASVVLARVVGGSGAATATTQASAGASARASGEPVTPTTSIASTTASASTASTSIAGATTPPPAAATSAAPSSSRAASAGALPTRASVASPATRPTSPSSRPPSDLERVLRDDP